MNVSHYQAYKELKNKGLKEQAKKSLEAFITSFTTLKEKEIWVWEFLSTIEANQHVKIRHEIFNELVYPILKYGYDNDDFMCTFWLGKLIQNIYQATHIHKELNWVTEIDLYEKSHKLNPNNNEVRKLLLKSTIQWLLYSEHEYPTGILFGNNGATPEECDELNKEVQKALLLDIEKTYTEFLEEYAEKLNEYRARID